MKPEAKCSGKRGGCNAALFSRPAEVFPITVIKGGVPYVCIVTKPARQDKPVQDGK